MASATAPRAPIDFAAAEPPIGRAAAVFAGAREVPTPFRHWLFSGALPEELSREVLELPVAPPPPMDNAGKRDSHNDLRRFFSPDMQAQFPVMRLIAQTFQSAPVVRAIEGRFGIDCAGSYLRIEYCQDRDGFWLEPHMDIKEKLMTMQLYLNTGPDAATLGTDLYDADRKFVSRGSGTLGEGMVFIPKEPLSWHGFDRRPIAGVRRSLLVNYVTPDWRARHELSFPDRPIGA